MKPKVKKMAGAMAKLGSSNLKIAGGKAMGGYTSDQKKTFVSKMKQMKKKK